ncbi:MAG: hypothetical protein JWO97_3427 [Acidobacteria bacterium]|nr:hypothetical protein [Acidobacteriota bacterium]
MHAVNEELAPYAFDLANELYAEDEQPAEEKKAAR